MTKNRKNYNSVIFLTTLSVYLGLALVGAPAPILAQAALTSRLEVKNKVQRKDDLDKDPTENDLFASSLVSLVGQLNRLSEKGSFDWNVKDEFEIESFAFCESDNLPSFMGSGSINRQVDYELEKASIEIARRLFEKITELKIGNKYDRIIDYKFSFDNKSLDIQTKIKFESEKDSQFFAKALTSYLNQITSISKLTNEKTVAENTEVNSANNQVFIVTRLPRGSLDALLAQRSAK